MLQLKDVSQMQHSALREVLGCNSSHTNRQKPGSHPAGGHGDDTRLDLLLEAGDDLIWLSSCCSTPPERTQPQSPAGAEQPLSSAGRWGPTDLAALVGAGCNNITTRSSPTLSSLEP